MNYQTLWTKIKPYAGVILSVIAGGGATWGADKFMQEPEVVVPISAGRHQLIQAGHVDPDYVREALNQKLDEVFREAGFCKDPVIAEREVARTAKLARCAPEPR